eukprot:2235496-Rhodomonas_salina.1
MTPRAHFPVPAVLHLPLGETSISRLMATMAPIPAWRYPAVQEDLTVRKEARQQTDANTTACMLSVDLALQSATLAAAENARLVAAENARLVADKARLERAWDADPWMRSIVSDKLACRREFQRALIA